VKNAKAVDFEEVDIRKKKYRYPAHDFSPVFDEFPLHIIDERP
jgi:hypothetical protein